MNKQKRHRQKCQREGRCPHCGKPCLPYAECDDRRDYKRIQYYIRRMFKFGMLDRRINENGNPVYGWIADNPNVVWKKTEGPNDGRYFPRWLTKSNIRKEAIEEWMNAPEQKQILDELFK